MSVVLSRISKTYPDGTRALKDVSLSFERGTLGLLGPNGSGKTTLMRILATLLPQTSGDVSVFGVSLAGKAAIRAMLGYLPQTFGFYPQFTVRETLDYFANLKGVDNRRRVDDLLETVGLAQRQGIKVRGLSGGMKQRLGIAVALLNDPRLLIIDEPTAGLDPEGRVELRNLISSLPGDRTVIISSHIVEDMAQSASVVAVLFRGTLLFMGTPTELARQAEGRVWEGDVSAEDLAGLRGTHYVMASVRTGDTLRVRCVGPGNASLRSVTPALEDGFMVLLRKVRLECEA